MLFFCLKDHLIHYRKELSKYGIWVYSIEDTLNENHSIKEVRLAAKKVKAVMQKCLALGRGSVRDRVTIKEFFGLFVSLSFCGYVADTNHFPMVGSPVFFPHRYEEFRVVADSLSPKYLNETDVYLTYTPRKNPARAASALKAFYYRFNEADAIYEQEDYSERYYTEMTKVVMHASET